MRQVEQWSLTRSCRSVQGRVIVFIDVIKWASQRINQTDNYNLNLIRGLKKITLHSLFKNLCLFVHKIERILSFECPEMKRVMVFITGLVVIKDLTFQ